MQNDAFLIGEVGGYEQVEGNIVVTAGSDLVVPAAGEFFWPHGQLPWRIDAERTVHYLGRYNGENCFALEVTAEESAALDLKSVGLRDYLGKLPDGLFRLLGRALQITDWYRSHRYCGTCGAETALLDGERARACQACGQSFYPRLSPCIMALITRGDECLLARNKQWTRPFFSALAGFVEPGESAEEALRREVMEEVGLRVGELHYHASQPWPFPGQLMIGFFADYAGGDIRVDDIEIAEARWFHYNDLPDIPGEFALSGQLIRAFVNRCRARRGA
ncbi:MAG TPA: NAD(+) diphosphatase [Porticoccaceae bacterium]|nr:NAD(+) diphosphatase [Porticoccaceae bacterium]